MIARSVVAEGKDAERVAAAIADGLAKPDLRCAFVFADWRLDARTIASHTHRVLSPAAVVGCSTTGVIGPHPPTGDHPAAVGLGLYGDAMRFGIGVAADLPKSALATSRDAVAAAAAELGTTIDKLESDRHYGLVLVDGGCGHEETCCIGSAAAAPQIAFVGGSAATEPASDRRPHVWSRGEVMIDAAVVILLETDLPCHTVQSAHLLPTDIRMVVTGASGRLITELDGSPAVPRLVSMIEGLGGTRDDIAGQYSFARYVDGTPYVRSVTHLDNDYIHVACAVEPGHVLRLMRGGDLIGQTSADLAAASEKVGGMSAFLGFSCIGRHLEAAARGIERELAEVYAAYPTVGFQSYGEQSGMLLCNHTLTGLAIGKERR